MAQVNITRGGILAAAGFSLWFDTNLRANIIHLNNLPIHIPPVVLLNDLTTTTNIHNTEHIHTFSCKQRHHSKIPGHRQAQTTQTRIPHTS
jgi:hypothetical protein